MPVQQLSRKADAHTDAVWCTEWLSNNLLLTGSVDGLLKLWQIENEQFSLKWTSESGEFQMGVVSIARLVEGKSFAASSMDGAIRIFSLAEDNNKCKLVRRIEAGPVDCWTLCSSADGTEIASGTSTGAVNLWDVSTGKLRRTFETHGGFVLSIARTQDTLACGTKDGSVFLVNLLTSEVLATASRFHQLPVRTLQFNQQGDRLYTGSDDGLACCVTVPGGEKVGVLKGHLSAVLGVAVASTCVVTSSSDRKVRVWDLEAKECTSTFEAHTGQAFCVAFSPNHTLLVSGGAAGEVQLYSVSA